MNEFVSGELTHLIRKWSIKSYVTEKMVDNIIFGRENGR